MIDEAEFQEKILKLDIENGDVLVVKCGGVLEPNVRARISEQLKQFLSTTELKGVKVLVIEQGMDLEVLRATPKGG